MSAMIKLFGNELQSSSGTVATGDALKGKKAVGLYFSAHWCPPCRGFTPKLAGIYKELVKDKPFEVVFVSSDRDEESFASYFGEQPWLALPYAARDKKAELSKKFKVSGIPTLVIVDGETGATITTDGRSAVMEDPKGEQFPWAPPTLWEALGDEVLGKEGDVSVDELRGEGKVLGLYFSAHWCPPCRGFTPQLIATYEKVKAAGKQFEMIFVSSDKDQKQFGEYFGTMPWLAIPPGDKRKEQLSKLFNVEGIPALVLIDAATGETINANGRGAVGADPEGAAFPWYPKPVNDFAETADGINETASLCLMMEGCSAETQASLTAVLTPLAEAAAKAAKAGEAEEMVFFTATKAGGGPVDQVRKLTSLGSATAAPQLLLLDIPDQGGFYTHEGEVSADSIAAFIAKYKAGSLERKQLG